MRNVINDVLAQAKAIWSRLDAGQRLVVSVVTLATLLGLGSLVWFAGRPSYETVFTAKTGDEAARVKAALQAESVTYNVSDDGRSFLVERSRSGLAQQAILQAGLTGASMPSIGGTSSLIEDSETKAFRLDAAARAGAVAAIQQLDGVIQATVTASRPKRQPAYRDRDAEMKASATVVLRLRPNTSFESIARVASSIASSQLMVPQANIEVASATGNQRYRHDPDRDSGAGTSEFLSLQRSMSDERTQLAQDRLDQLWPGKTSVAVTVELDPSWEIRSEKVIPTEALVSSETYKKDRTETPAGKAADAAAGSSSNNETRDRKYVTEIGERRVGKAMHDVKRMTVAVMFDRSLEQQQGFSKDELIASVKAIVGWDPARDKPDAFSTMACDFAPAAAAADAAAGPGFGELALQWGPTVGQVVGVLVVVLFLRGLFQRSRRAAPAAAGGAAAPSRGKDEEREQERLELLPPDEQQKRLRKEIERSIANDPAALAKLLETWIVEQKA
jgi:flagellar M-ring protein FliF